MPKTTSGCDCESGARASHAAYLRGATLQARCQLAGAGPRGRFECEHRFKQRFQAMRNMRCFELFDWEAHLIFERGGSQTRYGRQMAFFR